MMFNFNKKAIGPVVASSLLVAVLVVIGIVGFQTWFNTYQTGVQTDVEHGSNNDLNVFIETIIGENLYIRNGYLENITIVLIKIDGNDCNINGSYDVGLNQFDVSSCINHTVFSHEILVQTNDKIISKKVKIKNLE